MKIYTKTGDQGETGLLGGPRVSKASATIEAIGCLDELNAAVGRLRSQLLLDDALNAYDPPLADVQNVLFQIGAVVADQRETPLRLSLQPNILLLEQQIDAWEEKLPPLTQFILPFGCLASSEAHFVRGICRRAERRVVDIHAPTNPSGTHDTLPQAIVYLNRLSDFLFVMARSINHTLGITDQPWEGIPASDNQHP